MRIIRRWDLMLSPAAVDFLRVGAFLSRFGFVVFESFTMISANP
jgi:hypothetical protein